MKEPPRTSICFKNRTGGGGSRETFVMSVALWKNTTGLTDSVITLQVRDRGFYLKDYTNCTLLSYVTGSEYRVVKCKIPKKKYEATQIHRLTVTYYKTTVVRARENGTTNATRVVVIDRYPISHVEQSCVPLHLKESKLLTVLLGRETPSRDTSSLYVAHIEWRHHRKPNKVNNNATSLNNRNFTTTTTRVYVDGEYNAEVECACPQLNQCGNDTGNHGKSGNNRQCSLYMIGFTQCTTYRLCLQVGDGDAIMCDNLRVPCTNYNRVIKYKKDETAVALFIALFVFVALILLFMIIARSNILF